MTLKEHTLDLTDRIEEISNRLDEIDERKEELKSKAIEIKQQKEGEGDAKIPKRLSDDWDDIDGEQVEIEGEREKLIETVVGWCTDIDPSEVSDDEIHEKFSNVDSCDFVVRELTFGQLQGVSDEMMEASFDVDVERQNIQGTPKQGFYQIELLRESLIAQPSGAPQTENEFGNDAPAPSEYPIPVGEWLFEKVDALNTTGSTQMGNSSLEEAVKYKR